MRIRNGQHSNLKALFKQLDLKNLSLNRVGPPEFRDPPPRDDGNPGRDRFGQPKVRHDPNFDILKYIKEHNLFNFDSK